MSSGIFSAVRTCQVKRGENVGEGVMEHLNTSSTVLSSILQAPLPLEVLDLLLPTRPHLQVPQLSNPLPRVIFDPMRGRPPQYPSMSLLSSLPASESTVPPHHSCLQKPQWF